MNRTRKVLDAAYRAGGFVAAACILGVFLVMVGSAISRQFGIVVSGSNDIVAWLSAAAAFLGLAHTFKHGDLVRVGILLDMVPDRFRNKAEILILAISIGFAGFMAWWASIVAYESFEVDQLADGLIALPVWIPQSTFVIGAMLLLIALIDELFIVCRGAAPTYERLARARRAAGDYSSEA